MYFIIPITDSNHFTTELLCHCLEFHTAINSSENQTEVHTYTHTNSA